MKSPLSIKRASQWPANKSEVLDVCVSWYNSTLVEIDRDAIFRLPVGDVVPPPIGDTNLERLDAVVDLQSAAQFAIAMNSINYMFWSKSESGEFVRYQNNGAIGALAMTDAFKQAWEDPNSAISAARNGKPLSAKDVLAVFGEIPDPVGRAEILNEVLVGSSLQNISQEIAQRNEFNTELASRLAQSFPKAYGDEVLKKSQLAVSAIWREARIRGFEGDCDLTAFADYQIPNVLRALGILKYSDNLANKIDQGSIIEEHSPEEKAIRSASILAIEELAKSQGVSVADVDFWIWLKRKEPQTPFHLTYTTAY